MAESLLEQGLGIGDRAFDKAGGDVRSLAGPVKTIAIVGNAQARIDNGGLRYFLETEWVGCPPYSVFSEAFRAIGANLNADAIDAAVSELGFSNPERDVERRLQILEGPNGERIDRLEAACVDDVWQLLERFISKHREAVFFQEGDRSSPNKTKRRKR